MALLRVPGVGQITAKKLIAIYGSPQAVFEQDEASLKENNASERLVEALMSYDPCEDRSIEEEIEKIEASEVSILSIDDGDYPKNLAELSGAPTLLYVKGEILSQDDLAVAIVGTRGPSSYGIAQARRFSKYLVESGATIVSGMAMGIDGIAQRAAIDAGGRTIAVLGCGVDVVYPAMHRELYEKIIENGAVVSDYPLGIPAQPQNFPPRNRIISGLSRGVLVVEGGSKSGALITARYAADQGRDVFALPGNIDRPLSTGANMLIRDGATPVLEPADVAAALKLSSMPSEKRGAAVNEVSNLEGVAKDIYKAIDFDGKSIDNIVQTTGFSVSQILSTLTELEMRDIVKRLPGDTFARNI